MELATGYEMDRDHMLKLYARKDGSIPSSTDGLMKQLSLFIIDNSYADARWKGETLQEKITKAAQEARISVEQAMVDFANGVNFE